MGRYQQKRKGKEGEVKIWGGGGERENVRIDEISTEKQQNNKRKSIQRSNRKSRRCGLYQIKGTTTTKERIGF